MEKESSPLQPPPSPQYYLQASCKPLKYDSVGSLRNTPFSWLSWIYIHSHQEAKQIWFSKADICLINISPAFAGVTILANSSSKYSRSSSTGLYKSKTVPFIISRPMGEKNRIYTERIEYRETSDFCFTILRRNWYHLMELNALILWPRKREAICLYSHSPYSIEISFAFFLVFFYCQWSGPGPIDGFFVLCSGEIFAAELFCFITSFDLLWPAHCDPKISEPWAIS